MTKRTNDKTETAQDKWSIWEGNEGSFLQAEHHIARHLRALAVD